MMKYCPNCGNKLQSDKAFCNQCGTQLENENRKNKYRRITENNLKSINNTQQRKHNKSRTWKIIAIIGAIVILLSTLFFVTYFFYKNVISDNEAINVFKSDSQNNKNKEQTDVNVLSSNFSENYMNADNTDGYAGINIGMSKNDVKEKFGEPNDSISMDIGNVKKYNNIGVYYGIDKTVSSVYILPENISTTDFKNFHGEPTIETDSQLIYDDNPDNNFTIIINIDGDEIQSIENTYQIDEDTLNNMTSTTNRDNEVSASFTHEAINYTGGIEKILNTAFNAEDYTEQEKSLSDAKDMTTSWDSSIIDLKTMASSTQENEIISQLKGFRNQRDKILDNIEKFNDNSDSQAWQNAQEEYETLKIEIEIFNDEYLE